VAAAVVVEAAGRLVPGVLGNNESVVEESFSNGLLEYPHYTRPAEWEGATIPEVLRSGDHGKVERWRIAMSIARTMERRPDMIEARGGLTAAEQKAYDEFFRSP